MVKARIGLLLGDPAGIGPELVAKVLAEDQEVDADVIVIGDRRHFALGQAIAGTSLKLPMVKDMDGALAALSNDVRTVFLDYPTLSPADFTVGRVSAATGRVVLDTLGFALDLAKEGALDGLVYAPLNKEAMHRAGSPYQDELRWFAAHLQWNGLHGELNVLDDLWTGRVTSHVPLREVCSLITPERVYEAILLVHQTMKQAGVEEPNIAVAALNPHAGEGGLFGDEEMTVIGPGIERARAEGIRAAGPFPADTIFLRIRTEGYHAVVSMYHDQGQVATKLLGFHRGVTVSGGLPIPITTPAHGTALDIAGQGKANPEATRMALSLGQRMGLRRRDARLSA